MVEATLCLSTDTEVCSDSCFYVFRLAGGAVVLLILCVDDILLASSTEELVMKYAKCIAATVQVSSEGPLSTFLGIDVKVDRVAHGESIQEIRASCQEDSGGTTAGGYHLFAGESKAPEQFLDDFEYSAKVSCIMYLMCCMRPDICFAVG